MLLKEEIWADLQERAEVKLNSLYTIYNGDGDADVSKWGFRGPLCHKMRWHELAMDELSLDSLCMVDCDGGANFVSE